MLLNAILGGLALVSFGLVLWQWLAARGFSLHQRIGTPAFAPDVTLLKPLKGADRHTEMCLRSWLEQSYRGSVQVLFAVAAADDPVCAIVRKLLGEFPAADARLVVCGELTGANLKISKLVEVERLARHEVLVISDADVRVPPDFLAEVVAPLERPEVGLVNCFYRLANPTRAAMRWEAVAVNADFWSQVLQARSLKPLDFALGAVMATRRERLREIGGFAVLQDCLADDYQLGNRIACRGHFIELCPAVVECWSEPMGWGEVWKHQVRWARTVRVCQPAPYFFSILSNGTLWPLLWAAVMGSAAAGIFAAIALAVRTWTARDLQTSLDGASPGLWHPVFVLLKDLLQVAVWVAAFGGNTVEWRGQRLRLRRDGTLVRSGFRVLP